MPNHHNDPKITDAWGNDVHITPTLPYRIEDKRPIVDKVAGWVGLGGIRERWTNGELAYWMVSAAFLGFGLAAFVIKFLGW